MNRKQLVLLIVIGAVLGCAGWIFHQKNDSFNSGTESKIGEKLIADFPINDVARITIRNATNEVNLVKRDDGWILQERGDYPARYSSISDFLRKVWDMKITKPVKVGKSRLPQLELLAPPDGPGTLVEFQDESGKVTHTLLLGAKHMRESSGNSQFGGGGWPDGRYVMLNSDINHVSLVSEPLTEIEPKPSQWLDTEFFKVANVRSLAVDFPEGTNSWKLVRETSGGTWQLAEPKADEELDTTKLSTLSNPLANPSFTDVNVATSVTPEDTGLDSPKVISIETFDGFKYDIKVGQKTDAGNYYLTMNVSADLPSERTAAEDEKPEDKERLDKEFADKQKQFKEKLAKEEKFEGWVFEVASWSVDSILKNRSDLMKEKKPEAEEASATGAGETSNSGAEDESSSSE